MKEVYKITRYQRINGVYTDAPDDDYCKSIFIDPVEANRYAKELNDCYRTEHEGYYIKTITIKH